MKEQIHEIGKEISLAYKFYQGYGYFLSSTVAEWLGVESLDWQHKTILDLCVIDLIKDAIHDKRNKHSKEVSFIFHAAWYLFWQESSFWWWREYILV